MGIFPCGSLPIQSTLGYNVAGEAKPNLIREFVPLQQMSLHICIEICVWRTACDKEKIHVIRDGSHTLNLNL